LFVIDRSGSMTGSKIETVKAAVQRAISVIAPADNVGVVTFDSQARVAVPIQPVGDKENVRSQVSKITAGGGTWLLPALEKALLLLRQVNTRRRHVIVFSDGEVPDDGLLDLVTMMRKEGITVSAVGVDGAADGLFGRLAAAGGGRVYRPHDYSTIAAIFVKETQIATTARAVRPRTH
jgi:Ca-activated chloride channel homolog